MTCKLLEAASLIWVISFLALFFTTNSESLASFLIFKISILATVFTESVSILDLRILISFNAVCFVFDICP